ncbi:hypothetical protein RRG08_036162 [Elysia crispata]|uniref:Uncharacterized protein n=1 Tax=Elysia crispata TaxID=231223 RepID=A0AAE0XE19_9GAST|nr:hypothetical protein RRG08_036162 [Elysia crispata]
MTQPQRYPGSLRSSASSTWRWLSLGYFLSKIRVTDTCSGSAACAICRSCGVKHNRTVTATLVHPSLRKGYSHEAGVAVQR